RLHPVGPVTRRVIGVVRVRIAAARDSGVRIILVGQQATTVVNETLPSTIFQLMRQYLAETVVGEHFVRRGSIPVLGIIDMGDKVRVRIASVGGYLATLVADSLHVMSRYVARSLVIVGVIDVSATGMSDSQDLAGALLPRVRVRRRAAQVRRSMIVSVRDRIDIPVGIVAQLCSVVLKIGIA